MNREAGLKDVRDGALRKIIGTYCDGNPGLSVDGAAANDVELDNAVSTVINGLHYALAADTGLDISADTTLAYNSLHYHDVTTTLADDYIRAIVFCYSATGQVYLVESKADYPNATAFAADATLGRSWTVAQVFASCLPDIQVVTTAGVAVDVCPIGAMIVENTTAGAAIVIGTNTVLDTDATFYNFARYPGGLGL
jgi:hypothetical protein